MEPPKPPALLNFEGTLGRLQSFIGESVSALLILGTREAAGTKMSMEGILTRAHDRLEGMAQMPPSYRGSISFIVNSGGSFTLSPHDFVEGYWSDADPATGEVATLSANFLDGSTLHVFGPRGVVSEPGA